MPNYCSYEMKIVGKKKNIDKLVSYLGANYSYDYKDIEGTEEKSFELEYCTADKHFFRVFECEQYDEDEFNKIQPDEETSLIVWGSCAWSVVTCMFDQAYGTYYRDWVNDGRSQCKDFRGTHMVEATRDLDLVVEIFSEEPGCEFQEHFIVDKGNILEEECVEWRELYDEDGEPILDEYGDQVTEGGLDWEYTI